MQRWNPYETALGVGNVGGLKLKWSNPIGSYDALPSSITVVNGLVYFGSDDGNVYALNASTGAKVWSFATAPGEFSNFVQSTPAVVNGVVYVGSRDGNFYALNANTGAKLWSYTTTPNTQSFGNEVNSSPAVANGVVYFGSENHNVYALDAGTGVKLWSYTTGAAVDSNPAVANGIVYFGAFPFLYAFNASTGAVVWSKSLPTSSSPAVSNGVVYIGTANGFSALNAGNGAQLWSFTGAVGDTLTAPAVANGVVYFSAADSNLYALNASTGAKLWSYAAGPSNEVSSPALANGVVYVAFSYGLDSTDKLYALNASTGALLWSYPVRRDISSPTVVNGVVYFRSGDSGPDFEGNISAFSLGSADLFLRVQPTATTVHQGDLLTFAFPVWNLGPNAADKEVLNTQVPAGTVFDYVRISGTPGLGTCTTPPYQGTGQIVCHENSSMAPNTTWTVRLTVKVTAATGTTITENAATMSDTPDPNMANNMATASVKVQ